MNSNRPSAVAFDVIETLISLEPLGAQFTHAGLDPQLVRAWFPRMLLYGLALSATGDYVPFPVAAAEALRAVSGYTLSDAAVAEIVAAFGQLPAHRDVEPAMSILAAAGVRMICLTNGSAAATQAFLDRCELAHYVEAVVATEEVGSWKPPAKVYHHGAARLGLPPQDVALVAVHAWDCHGAKRAGLMAGWAARLEGRYGEIFTPADVTGSDLVEVAVRLVEL